MDQKTASTNSLDSDSKSSSINSRQGAEHSVRILKQIKEKMVLTINITVFLDDKGYSLCLPSRRRRSRY